MKMEVSVRFMVVKIIPTFPCIFETSFIVHADEILEQQIDEENPDLISNANFITHFINKIVYIIFPA